MYSYQTDSKMRKTYIKPTAEIYILDTSKGILAGSYQAADPDDQLAPPIQHMDDMEPIDPMDPIED